MIPVYCIHLPHKERRKHIEAELARVGFDDITYIHAQEPVADFTANNMRRNPRNEFGCSMSHIKAQMAAISDGCTEALFVEDDAVFADNAWQRLADALDQLDHNYSVLYLGGHPRGPVERLNWIDLYQLKQAFACTEAYCMPAAEMRHFIQFWCDRAGQKNAMIDFILGEFAGQRRGYAFYPTLTTQAVGWSVIGKKIDDKADLIERGWQNQLIKCAT